MRIVQNIKHLYKDQNGINLPDNDKKGSKARWCIQTVFISPIQQEYLKLGRNSTRFIIGQYNVRKITRGDNTVLMEDQEGKLQGLLDNIIKESCKT